MELGGRMGEIAKGEAAMVEYHPWSIVLAGGAGERTRAFVRARFGHDKPKQYCTFLGTRSVLQHTLDRADKIAPAKQRVIVAARHHRSEITKQLATRSEGRVLFQPRNLDTAPGVFLPLSHVLANDPEATVAIFPSDHFIAPEERFIEAMSQALNLSRQLAGRPLLIGVEPDRPEPEYGWIETGPVTGSAGWAIARTVERFIEKPPVEKAEQIARRGGLWNTSILVAKASELWQLGWQYLPEIMPCFADLREAFRDPPSHVESILARLYSRLPARNFSRHLLEPASARLSVMKLEGCSWSDWGSPARILGTLGRLGKQLPGCPADIGVPIVAAHVDERSSISLH